MYIGEPVVLALFYNGFGRFFEFQDIFIGVSPFFYRRNFGIVSNGRNRSNLIYSNVSTNCQLFILAQPIKTIKPSFLSFKLI